MNCNHLQYSEKYKQVKIPKPGLKINATGIVFDKKINGGDDRVLIYL